MLDTLEKLLLANQQLAARDAELAEKELLMQKAGVGFAITITTLEQRAETAESELARVRAELAAEREACAKIADERGEDAIAQGIANQIRARGAK